MYVPFIALTLLGSSDAEALTAVLCCADFGLA